MNLPAAKEALKKYFGYDSFRPNQAEIIENVLAGKDTVVLMPTGGGKSICFQIPALVMPGTCVVVSPLIALMKDQVEGLKANGVKAEFMNSSRTGGENIQVENLLLGGHLDMIYVSPEKLMSADFMRVMDQLQPSLIAIDEAHCISQWGHDFRPEYTQLGMIKERFSSTPVIALTATADKLTRKDIVTHLRLDNPKMFVASFDRPNLSLTVLPGRDRFNIIHRWIKARPGQSGIIYCLSRKSTEDLAGKLKDKGIDAAFYHAGLGPQIRSKVQERFIRDDVPIICATIAFGMGIDKSNVRWIIHYNLPKNMESYYQEIGRAGRDGLPSETLLFYSYADVMQLQSFIEESGQKEILETKLKRIQDYANARICRRKVLLSYFSESLAENCGNCDICKDPPETIDGTTLAQKALSALVRLREMVGTNMLIDVLRGSARQDLLAKGYDQIKTYGAGSDIPRADWQQYMLQLINMGLLEIAYDEGNALKLSEMGREVLFKGRKIELVRPSEGRLKKKAPPVKKISKAEQLNNELFQRLRTLRKQIADSQGVPPYIVFNDETLKIMASEMPVNRSKMANIKGVGKRKLEVYSEDFINLILTFVQEKHAEGNRIKGASEVVSFEMFKKGKSVVEIAKEREIAQETVYSHFRKLYEEGNEEVDLFKFMTVEELHDILAAFMKVGVDKGIRPVFEHFEEKVPYWKLQFALAYRNRLTART